MGLFRVVAERLPKDVRFGQRQRIITPLRLGLALTTTCASQHVEPIADFHRAFPAFWGTTSTYKAFYNHVAKPHCADCARTRAARLISAMTLPVLGCETGRAVGEFRHIILQDGSSLALHDSVREGFPGRCKAVKPAAVALHTTLDLVCEAPTPVVLPPDTAHAQAFVPEPTSLRDSVLWADRGSLALPDRRRVQDENGCGLIRAKAGRHPQGVAACREDGPRLRSLRHQPRKAIHAPRPTRQRVELGGRGKGDGHPLCLRLMSSWNPRTKSVCSCLTHLPPTRYPLEGICRAYTGRWPVDRRLKAWQSSANLHACATAKVAIVAGLMWTAIATAALTRFLAHMTHLLLEVPMSTRQVAMCALPVFGDMVRAWQSGDVAGLYAALEAAVPYLACHAQRAHPERDRHTGRAQLGLEPLFGNDDVIECAEAA